MKFVVNNDEHPFHRLAFKVTHDYFLYNYVNDVFPEALLLSPDPKQYVWVCQGVTVVDIMEGGEELRLTCVSRHVFALVL